MVYLRSVSAIQKFIGGLWAGFQRYFMLEFNLNFDK